MRESFDALRALGTPRGSQPRSCHPPPPAEQGVPAPALGRQRGDRVSGSLGGSAWCHPTLCRFPRGQAGAGPTGRGDGGTGLCRLRWVLRRCCLSPCPSPCSWGSPGVPAGQGAAPELGRDPGFATFVFPAWLVVPKVEAIPEGDGEEPGAAGEPGSLEHSCSGEGVVLAHGNPPGRWACWGHGTVLSLCPRGQQQCRGCPCLVWHVLGGAHCAHHPATCALQRTGW